MYSRLGRTQEKKLTTRIAVLLGISLVVVVFFAVFGLNLLIGFSVFIESIRGKPPEETKTGVYIRPPVLNPIPEATNSARLVIRGFGTEGMNVTLLKNDAEEETVRVGEDGTFIFRNLILKDGAHTFRAYQTDETGNRSADSDTLTTEIVMSEPEFTVTEPQSDLTLRGEENQEIVIRGTAGDGLSITVNGRVIVVRQDLTFSTSYRLNEGENRLNITATDEAGNSKTVEKIITYEK